MQDGGVAGAVFDELLTAAAAAGGLVRCALRSRGGTIWRSTQLHACVCLFVSKSARGCMKQTKPPWCVLLSALFLPPPPACMGGRIWL